MQRSGSVLLKPTLYESFSRSWSTTTPSATIKAATTLTSSSTVRDSFTSTSHPSSIASSQPYVTSAHSIGKGLFEREDLRNPKTQIRTMASTQPLTQSTMPTAEEMKLEVPLSEIKTAPGVNLDDGQKVIVGSVLDLFAGKPSLRKLTLWNQDGVFHDPLTNAEGHSQYAAQWYGLAAAFSSIQRLSHEVTSSGNPITMNLSTKYVLKGLGTEKQIDSVVDIYLDKSTGKIERVEDKWGGEIGQGSVVNAFRKLNAVTVPLAVKVPKSIEEEEGKK